MHMMLTVQRFAKFGISFVPLYKKKSKMTKPLTFALYQNPINSTIKVSQKRNHKSRNHKSDKFKEQEK